jgi:hypothetical protein
MLGRRQERDRRARLARERDSERRGHGARRRTRPPADDVRGGMVGFSEKGDKGPALSHLGAARGACA